MASLLSQLRTYLRADASILALVGARVRARRLDQGETMPAIRLAIVAGTEEAHLGGGSDLAHAVVQIDAYGGTSEAADALAELIRLRLRSGQATMGSISVRSILMATNLRHHSEPIDDGGKLFREISSRDYRISYKQATS